MDKLRQVAQKLARTSKQTTSSVRNTDELTKLVLAGPFGTKTKNLSELSPQEQAIELVQMLGLDGTVAGLYELITTDMVGVDWSLTPFDESPEAVRQANEIETMFRLGPHQGGMSSPFKLFTAQCGLATLTGFSPFEKVFQIYPNNNLIGYKKISWMDPSTVEILRTPDGSFNGFKQEFTDPNGNEIKATLPPEACFLYPFKQEIGGLYGRSAFVSAYNFHKRKLKTLDLLADKNVKDAHLMKIVQPREGTSVDQGDLQTTVAAVESGSSQYRATVGVSQHFDVSTLSMSNSNPQLLETIALTNSEIVLSVLGQVITLGGGSSSGSGGSGSYALSKEQAQILSSAIEGYKEVLSSLINHYIFAPLFAINYPNPLYATFRLDVVDKQVAENNYKLFLETIKKGNVSPLDLDAVVGEGFRVSKITRPEPEEVNNATPEEAVPSGDQTP